MAKKITIILGLDENNTVAKMLMSRWSTILTKAYGGCTAVLGEGMYQSPKDGRIDAEASLSFTVYTNEDNIDSAVDIAKQMCHHHKQECVLFTVEDIQQFTLIEG